MEDPPWGALSTEAYLLRKWDPACEDDPKVQRVRIIERFLAGGALQIPAPRATPTEEQISSILQPWRTPVQRELANTLEQSINPAIIWLRTCYLPTTDALHTALLDPFDLGIVIDDPECNLLDDAELYDYGPDWFRIFHSIPEILVPPARKEEENKDLPSGPKSHSLHQALMQWIAFRDHGIQGVPTQLLHTFSSFLSGKELEDTLRKVLVSGVHGACVQTWMVVEDEEALMGGKEEVLLLYLDHHGAVVRQSRIHATITQEVSGAWQRCSWHETPYWEDAVVGEAYIDIEELVARLADATGVGGHAL